MKRPDLIITEKRPTAWRIPLAGWAAVYTLAVFMAGALIYFATRKP